AQAGDGEAALRVFAANGAALDSRFGHQRALEEVGILTDLGRTDEAIRRLDVILADTNAEPMAWVQAGLAFERLGHEDRAASAMQRAAESAPIANYYLARLKLRSGDADTAMDCLKHAALAAPAEVRRLIREEEGAWQELAGDARFEQLRKPVAATPGR
ncbi:MAG: hypothetical protein KDC98_08315, partial [Planctomycetes bacterium]|nr:hypothetical protein [Planctomycetota bacterium]